MRALLLVLLVLATSAWTSLSRADENISAIPRIGFKTVKRIVAGGLCTRVADAMLARENINVGEDNVDAILIVRPLNLEKFPKRIDNLSQLSERLSSETELCADDQLSQNTAALVYEKKPDGSLLRVLKYVLDSCVNSQSSIFCADYVFEPGDIAIVFSRGSVRIGIEQLKKGFDLSSDSPFPSFRLEEVWQHPKNSTADASIMKRMFEDLNKEVELRPVFSQNPDSALLPADFYLRYLIRVDPGQEEQWASILNRLPFVEYAAREPLSLAAAEADRLIKEVEETNKLPRSPVGSATIQALSGQARCLDFLRDRFAKRGGTLTVIKQDDNRLRVRIDHLRGEVIRREGFWEYLKINLILIEDQGQTKLYLMNDGFYAAGVGNEVPPDASFRSMEIDYYSSLSEFTEALATQIQQDLGHQR